MFPSQEINSQRGDVWYDWTDGSSRNLNGMNQENAIICSFDSLSEVSKPFVMCARRDHQYVQRIFDGMSDLNWMSMCQYFS
jgi:hypothetical protein